MLDNYVKLDNGIIKQINLVKNNIYNLEYNAKYNNYGENGPRLAHLRLGYLLGAIGRIPDSILDVGYGNGDFLKVASECITNCYGTDITRAPLPEKVKFLSFDECLDHNFDVITFFDSLEHFDDIYLAQKLNCKYILITLPWCHYEDDDWFKNWKHRRPDEHLWHFNKNALINFMDEIGYECLQVGIPFEDVIRVDRRYIPNILTGVFKKKQ